MAVRTTVDTPEPLHDRLRQRAERPRASIRSLIVRAIEKAYSEPGGGAYVKGPLVTGPGKLGPAFPEDENPHDRVFSRPERLARSVRWRAPAQCRSLELGRPPAPRGKADLLTLYARWLAAPAHEFVRDGSADTYPQESVGLIRPMAERPARGVLSGTARSRRRIPRSDSAARRLLTFVAATSRAHGASASPGMRAA